MSVAWHVLTTGLGFPEGPVRLGAGDIAFVELQGQRVSRCSNGERAMITPVPGGPNGMARARDGSLFVANNGGLNVGPHGYWHAPEQVSGRIQRIHPDGGLHDLVVIPGEHARPNDICFGPDGALYFTDPRNWDDLANLLPGRVWRCSRDGGGLTLLDERGMFPNGLAFAPDGGTLYVAYSITQEVLAFPVSDRGLGEPTVHAKLPSGFPDGMAVASDGTLVVCGSMGHVIHRFGPDGSHREAIEMPDGSEPTNVCIGDGLLYVTMSGTGELLALPTELEALPLYD